MPYYGLNIEIMVHSQKHQPVNLAYKVLGTICLFFSGNYPPGVDKASARDVNSLMNEMTSYLVRCYSKVLIEENDHKKRSSVPPLSVALTASRIQTVNYTSLVLQGV